MQKKTIGSLYGNQTLHVLFWSMVYLPLKFEINVTVNFRNGIVISIASKSWTRLESRILIPIHALSEHFSNFGVVNMSDFTKQNFNS